jgi:exodeoxyribonuclease VII small subunit
LTWARKRWQFTGIVEADPTPPEEEPSFEQVLERLAELVGQLEGGDLPLERSLMLFEEGIRLSRLGARRLDHAERRVEMLLADDEGGVHTRPLEDEESRGR